jgi:23S rRNA G2069 N7-methylase RlmK/C1962 C5-methylase RlmI
MSVRIRTCAARRPRPGERHGDGELPELLTIVENGVRMEVDVVSGHKTGFYLDQRDNRLLTGQLAAGRDVLNCFCYTGGFSLQALAGGAKSVISIDRPARRWPPRRATWRSTRSSTPAAPNGARTTSSRPCAPSRPRAASST